MSAPRPSKTPAPTAVDLDAVRAVCERATRHNDGPAVHSAQVTDAGVHVRLSSWPRQMEAVRALYEVGYAADIDDPVLGVMVTGWDPERLAMRWAETRDVQRDLEFTHNDIAATAINQARAYLAAHPDHHQVDTERIAASAAVAAGRDLASSGPPATGLSPVSSAQISAAPAERRDGHSSIRDQLIEIAAREQVTQQMQGLAAGSRTAVAAIQQFIIRRQAGLDDRRAAEAAHAATTRSINALLTGALDRINQAAREDAARHEAPAARPPLQTVAETVDLDAQLRWLTWLHDQAQRHDADSGVSAEQLEAALRPMTVRVAQARAALHARDTAHLVIAQETAAAIGTEIHVRVVPQRLDRYDWEVDEDLDLWVEQVLARRVVLDEDREQRALAEPVTRAQLAAASSTRVRDVLVDFALTQRNLAGMRAARFADTAHMAVGTYVGNLYPDGNHDDARAVAWSAAHDPSWLGYLVDKDDVREWVNGTEARLGTPLATRYELEVLAGTIDHAATEAAIRAFLDALDGDRTPMPRAAGPVLGEPAATDIGLEADAHLEAAYEETSEFDDAAEFDHE